MNSLKDSNQIRQRVVYWDVYLGILAFEAFEAFEARDFLN